MWYNEDMVVSKDKDENMKPTGEEAVVPVEEAEVVDGVEVLGEGDSLAEQARVEGTGQNVTVEGEQELVSWDAEEYIVRDKTSWWYVGLAIVTLLLSGLAVLLQWWTFLAVVVLSAIALVVYTCRPPRVLHYVLTNRGLVENGQLREYANYKAFGILREGPHFAIMLVPRKRFSPRVTVFFPKSQGEAIVDAFGAHLPMEEIELDMIDKIIKFLRI